MTRSRVVDCKGIVVACLSRNRDPRASLFPCLLSAFFWLYGSRSLINRHGCRFVLNRHNYVMSTRGRTSVYSLRKPPCYFNGYYCFFRCGVKRMLILELTNRVVWHTIVLCLQVPRNSRQYSCFQCSRMSCFGTDGDNADLRMLRGRAFCFNLGFYLMPHLSGKQKCIVFAHEP